MALVLSAAGTSDVVVHLSYWEASVDFARAKSVGIAAVIFKETQGSNWIDVTSALRFEAAIASGLLVGEHGFSKQLLVEVSAVVIRL